MQYLSAIAKTTEWSLFVSRQAIQYHSKPSICPNHYYQRSWSWMVLWRSTRPFRTRTQKRCPFHHRGLECKSRKPRDTWSDRQIWPWSTKLSRTKSNSVLQENALVIANTLFQPHKRQLSTWTSLDGQYWNQIDYILYSWRWRSSIQSANKKKKKKKEKNRKKDCG